nr:uncharacterized protein LOC128697299 [Cherax quadricarinatus]
MRTKPESGPSLTGVQGPYTVGHLLLVNCSSPFSYPPTTLTWHINGHQASHATVVQYPGKTDGEGLEASWSGLHMCLQKEHFQEGVLVLRCTASILNVYKKSSQVTIFDSRYEGSDPPEGESTAVSPALPPHQPALICKSYPFNPAPSTCSIMPVTPSILPHQPSLLCQSYPVNPAPSTCSIMPVAHSILPHQPALICQLPLQSCPINLL